MKHPNRYGWYLLCAWVSLSAAPAHAEADASRRTLLARSGSPVTTVLDHLSVKTTYGVLVSVPRLAGLSEADRIEVVIHDAEGEAARKPLHAGDADFYFTLRPRKDGPGQIVATADGAPGKIHELSVAIEAMSIDGNSDVIVAAGPNHTWQTAQPIELGKTVIAGNDDRPYIPAADGPESTFKSLLAGAHWYTFTHQGETPVLVHFMVDTIDRDVPVNVTVFTRQGEGADAKLAAHDEGVERFIPEQSTTFHGLYKLVARTIKPGTYYVRVMGNHPVYQLRTQVYDSPPYLKLEEHVGDATTISARREAAARKAIRAGMDYFINKGDSWHANTPRRGSVVLRTSTALQETQLCIACHPTHFTTRAQLVAVENGWPVRQRPALKFLTERLYNNPRPLYGDPDTAWVRVISAPGNVTSRMAHLLMTFEKHISGEQRSGVMEDLTKLLEKYWVGVKSPIDESAGTLPRISGFEIAVDSHFVFNEMYRRTGNPKYADMRWNIEKVLLDSVPRDMIDLCWKAIGLAGFDRGLYSDEIDAMVAQIFSHQKEDGTWPLVFGDKNVGFDYYAKQHTETPAPLGPDGKPMYSEFQTYHCIYTLAKCGVTLTDARLAKAVDYCLSRQWAHGGWQGNLEYKNFDTVFRETQFAVMALSQLFPGPGSQGWGAGFGPPPKTISMQQTDASLAALNQYWEKPGAETLTAIDAGLTHPQPLVREAAVTALGRIADPGSLPKLAERLGDASKMVQRSAAWAIREIATRTGTGRDVILSALRSPDDRTRWGATLVFNQHFRYLAQDAQLLEALIERMQHDPVAIVRMTAAQALPKWWFWLKDAGQRVRIEQALVEGMARVEHPWVRRALIEGFRNTQDDNTRYLYNTWTPALKRPEDKQAAESAHKKQVLEQAQRIREVLTKGNDLQRDGVLRSFYTFHLHEPGEPDKVANVPIPETYVRENPTRGDNNWIDGYKAAATYDPLTMGTGALARLGNDSEPPEYDGESGPLVAQAFEAVLQEKDPTRASLNDGMLKAMRQAHGVPVNAEFSARLLMLAQYDRSTSKEVQSLLRELLPSRISDGPQVFEPMAQLIEAGGSDSVQLAAAILSNPSTAAITQAPSVAGALKKRLIEMPMDHADLPALIVCATHASSIHAEEPIVQKLFAILETAPPPAKENALRLMIASKKLLAAGEARKRFERMLKDADPATMSLLLKVVGSTDYSQPDMEMALNLALGILTTALNHAAPDVQLTAVDTVRAVARIQNNPAIVTAIRELAQNKEHKASASAQTLLASFDSRNQAAVKDVAELLDFDFFVQKVQPIFQVRGEDQNACFMCHANHSILKLTQPDVEGKLTEAQLRENYRNATKVVDLAAPENSLILRKPISSFDGIGVPGAYLKTHGGDIRWKEGANSEPYRTILQWVQGAKARN